MKKRNCVVCNKLFVITRKHSWTKKTCSNICRYSLVSKLFSQKIQKECLICNKEFIVQPMRQNAKFCSSKCYWQNLIGKSRPKEWYINRHFIPWNKGKKLPNLSKAMMGENNPAWKGGVYKTNLALRGSPMHKRWSRQVKQRDNYTCQLCGDVGRELNADHIKPFALFPKLRFEVSNGRTLCKPCHYLITYKAQNIDILGYIARVT